MSWIVLPDPILCLVTHRAACLERPMESVVAEAVEAGANMIQLREKDLSARQLLELGRSLLPVARGREAALVVNDRVDVALALGAEGVQLGAGSLPVRETRRLVGEGMLIGASVHCLEEARRAEEEGADYLLLGTIFETGSHPGKPAAGPGLVAQVSREVHIPIVAIGGLGPANAPLVMDAGASGVAVITAIQSAEDVFGATRNLLRALERPGRAAEARAWK